MQVKQLYQDPARYIFPTPEKKKLFHMKLAKRLRLSNNILLTWIDLVETRLRLDREEKARRTIVRWIQKKQSSS